MYMGRRIRKINIANIISDFEEVITILDNPRKGQGVRQIDPRGVALAATTYPNLALPEAPEKKPMACISKIQQTAMELLEVERNAAQLLASREKQLRIDIEKALLAEQSRTNDATNQFPSREPVSEKLKAFQTNMQIITGKPVIKCMHAQRQVRM